MFKSWTSFYSNLFLTQPADPDQIILTLNRMTKTSENQDGIVRNIKLLKRVAELLSLRFQEIQSLLPRKEDNVVAAKTRNKYLNNSFGKYFQL